MRKLNNIKHQAGYVPVKRKVSCLFVFLFSFTNMNLQQSKLIFLKGQKPFIPHPAQLIGHSTAVYGKKIRKLLSVEGNGNGTTVLLFCLFGQIRNQFFPRGTL